VIAERAAQRVNQLIGKYVAEAGQVDVTNLTAREDLQTRVDALVSAVLYSFNLDITRTGIKAKACMCDLGGNTDIVQQQQGGQDFDHCRLAGTVGSNQAKNITLVDLQSDRFQSLDSALLRLKLAITPLGVMGFTELLHADRACHRLFPQ
jgi:saccharopine dehydrogenase-like NADP-dependent oxidoreductase